MATATKHGGTVVLVCSLAEARALAHAAGDWIEDGNHSEPPATADAASRAYHALLVANSKRSHETRTHNA